MAVKIGSMLIEVAAGVARVESDMGKISKILSANTKAWEKMFKVAQVAATAWLSKEVLAGAVNAMQDFAAAGLKGAEQIKEHAAAASEFKQRQAELNKELEKFAGEVIGPLLPAMNDIMLYMKGAAKEAAAYAKASKDLFTKMDEIAEYAQYVSSTAAAWKHAREEIKEYAKAAREEERIEDERRKKEEERKKALNIPGLPTGGFKVDKFLKGLEAEGKAEEEARKKLAEQQRKEEEARRVERERQNAEAQQAVWDARDQREAERRMIQADIAMQTELGRRQQLIENMNYELQLTDWTEAERAAIKKKYAEEERKETERRYAWQMEKLTGSANAITQLTGAFLGENHKLTQKFAIAEAMINTYAGVTQALRFYPPPMSWIMAAQTLAMGMKQIKAIKASSAGGGGGAASVGGGANPSIQDVVPEAQPEQERDRQQGKIEIHIVNPIGERTWVQNNLVPVLEEVNRNRGWKIERVG